MAPRKRASSGGKKPNNPNREQQQSEPSKFGIQHFFERHSQTQIQKRCDDPTADSAANKNSRIVGKPIAGRSKVGPENPCDAVESRTECVRGVNTRINSVNANDCVSRNDTSGGNVPVEDHIGAVDVNNVEKTENLLKAEISSRSPDPRLDNLSPVVIDVEDNQLDVTPETSKSVSVKRFKFSPGMLIKQTQDDTVDEVTWKISPVNERLHAMSKHLHGRISVLADSTRFNSMNFQECSQEKVKISPNMSGKLEKWLSSPPLKPHRKSIICSDGLASRKVNHGLNLSCPGNHRNSNCTDKSGLRDSQSPFTTPPSLSCCTGKAVEEVGDKGVPNQLGSRQHKKALIELLDQVEDVISVESSSSKDAQSHLDVERYSKADVVVHRPTTHSEENRSTTYSNFSFLVLEVSEKRGLSGSSGGPPSVFKVLRLLNEQNGAERSLQLWDAWYDSVVAPGDTVHVVGEFDSEGKCDVNREKNFFIVHPDILVSGTRVSASFSCPRRTVLDERIKSTENSTAALIGTLLHQIYQAGLISESPTKESLEEYARTVLHKSLENLYACGANENDIFKTMIAAIPKILNWISSFRDSQGSKSPTVDFNSDEGLKKVKICEVIDIEEMVWGQRYGLKGMIDASLRVRTNTNSAEANEVIMPLEFKTGKGTSGQVAIEHTAQVMLYTLLMSERYMMNIECGLLYYLHTDETRGISVKRSDLMWLIMRRNELANDLLKASTTQQFPPMLQNPNVCRSCRHLNACSVYHKANGGTVEGSGLGAMYESLVSHLTSTHAIFLQKWERLIDLEAKHVEIAKKESWLSSSSRNDHHPISLSSLVLDNSDTSSERKMSRRNRFVYRFVSPEQPNHDPLRASSPLEHMFRNGDYVVLSTEPDHLRVSNGIIEDIGNFHVSVSLAKRLRLPGHSPRSMTEELCKQSWRIDKDEIMTSYAIMRFNLIQLFLQNESSTCLRKKVVDLEMPRFDSGCILSQDPAISYVQSEKSLNDDQRRAILKILTAKDYALILGMPGTGKTSTMVHAVKALLLRGASILLTSYTNSAVDNLLIKLKAQGVDFIRIGRNEAVHEEVQENCISVMNMNSTQDIKERLEKVNVVAVTCLGITSPLLTNKRFDICIMDEAGQITLPVSLGPLAFASRFVLVGDHYQLPPLVQSPEAKENGMSVSLFCRLSEAHPHAIAALHFQYRMCADIMELSNALIYGNRLRCGSTEIENAKLKYRSSASSPAWLIKVLDPNQPVIFINTDLLPAYESNDRKALNNPIEAHIIAEAVKLLVLRGIEGKAIGIITPYNAQANLIREAAPEGVEIHTIDKYQGRDKDCILVSFVKSSETPRNGTSSLLGDWHRINVALTRAKKKLIMVGSCRTLSKVPLLKLMIEKVEELCGMVVVSNKEIKYQPELRRCSHLI
ncbi:DNA replication ATP-dependent helicase/nuclease JHS1 [Salvia hispanica]|uniref:DNA replication ATP-dependent helicase/nuclease JHS1 n=1 Tax=Salvia hispanica TaxID=49212 RepID=UPI0020092900|nr:DNA replication ATP-dependent helicase/nuclease JHS1 [Salvia hispanica]